MIPGEKRVDRRLNIHDRGNTVDKLETLSHWNLKKNVFEYFFAGISKTEDSRKRSLKRRHNLFRIPLAKADFKHSKAMVVCPV